MMNDSLFFEEKMLVEDARSYLQTILDQDTVPKERFTALLEEYRSLLLQSIHITKVSDLMTNGLNSAKQSLEERVNLDELTGLFNKRHLTASLSNYYKDAMRSNTPLAVLFIDVDQFKKYNDHYGHVMGDICLASVAKALKQSTMRPFDFVARYGGEEFIILLPCVDKEGAMTVAKRVQDNVLALGLEHQASDVSDIVTVSIGATSVLLSPHTIFTIEDIVKTADEAMYISKSSGRNRVTYLNIKHEPT